MNKFAKLLVVSGMVAAMAFAAGCGDEKKPEPAKKDPKPAAAAPEKKKPVKLYTDEQLKKMTPAERAEARKKEYRANLSPEELHAHLITDKPEHKKFEKMVAEKAPHLKYGSVGWRIKNMVIPGEVIYGYHRVSGDEVPKYKLANGMEVRGRENYDIEVLYGACKGQCVIEANEIHTMRMNAEQNKTPLIEKKAIVPFDKTYIRHNENGKKWVTHEKCGTK